MKTRNLIEKLTESLWKIQ